MKRVSRSEARNNALAGTFNKGPLLSCPLSRGFAPKNTPWMHSQEVAERSVSGALELASQQHVCPQTEARDVLTVFLVPAPCPQPVLPCDQLRINTPHIPAQPPQLDPLHHLCTAHAAALCFISCLGLC